jgi:phthiocerol/phenolphthiocerol synthesis type-I polyketide synthase D
VSTPEFGSDELRDWLTRRVGEILGVPAESVDPHRPLQDAGLSSREALGMTGDLGRLLGRPLPATLAWQNPTIAGLAESLLAEDPLTGGEGPQALAPARDEPVAVVGLGCRLPGGIESPSEFWSFLESGTDGVTTVPKGRWESFAPAGMTADLPGRGGFLDDVAGFDAAFFGITPREAESMDPQQRILLEVTWAALEHAGIPPASLRGTRTGVFVGLSSTEYGYLTMTDLGAIDAWSAPGAASSIAANRLSYLFDLRGPSLTVDTACSSSLVAVHQAVQSLHRGEIDTALVAGVNLLLSPAITANFHRAGVLAADGRCKAFDASADGIARGEGCGVVVLRRLVDARRGNDRVLAVVRGSAVNSDGRSNGMLAPNPEAQRMLLRDAYSVAELDPSGVDYVEAHGTGTLLGDPIEAEALGAVLGAGRDSRRPLLIGSVKSNFGHLEGAAGIVGLVKVVLSLAHRRLPPSLHYTAPNPHIDFDGWGLRVNATAGDWPRYSGMARAGVSAFGFGGTNAHVVLEEWPGLAFPPRRDHREGPYLFALSARSAEGLQARAADLADWVDSPAGGEHPLGALAGTLARHREHLPVRTVVLTGERRQLAERLRAVGRGETAPETVSGKAGGRAGDVVFVFSGYGSQSPGMGRALLAAEPAFAAEVDALDLVFASVAGVSLRALLSGEAEQTGLLVTQLALFGMQLALAGLWRAHGVEPAAVLGHSMGEVAAAVVAGALGVADGLRVMATRARLLAGIDDSGAGAMAVVELSPAELAELESVYPSVTIAVYASPTQCTVSGDAEHVSALVAHVERLGRLARRLEVGGAGHSSAVDGLLDRFRAELRGIQPGQPSIPCYSSVLDDPRAEPGFGVDYWAANLRRPVRFAQALTAAADDGHTTFLELSPHPIALAAVDQTVGDRVTGLPSAHRKAGERTTFLTSLARLHVLGRDGVLDARSLPAAPIDLPAPRWRHRSFWPAPPPRQAGRPGGHPLLGTHVEVPGADLHLWHAEVGTEVHPWLADHAAMGVPVFPGTAYLELALAAARTLTPTGPLRVRDLELHRLLSLSAATSVTTSLAAGGSVSVHTKSAAGEWVRHATGAVRPGAWTGAPLGEVTEEQDGTRVVDLYALLDSLGQEYGPAFRGLRKVVAARGRASASIGLPGEARDDPAYVLHPALADACLHALAAAAGQDLGEAGGAYLPLTLGSAAVLGDPRHGVRVDAVVGSVDDAGAGLVGSVQLVDAEGAVLVALEDVYVRRFQRSALPVPLSDKVFEARWEQEGLAEAVDRPARTWLVLTGERRGEAQPGWVTALRSRFADRGDALVELPLTGGPGLAATMNTRREAGCPVAGVIVMAGSAADFPEPAEAGHLVPAVAKIVADLVAASAEPPRLWLVGSGGAAVEPAEAGCPALAALRGFVRVLAFEHPELRMSVLDFDAEPDPAQLWVSELRDEVRADSPADEVAWREGVRFVRRLARPELAGPDGARVVRDGAYVITGGLGGLGLVAARWLADRGATRIVLSGRRAASPESEPALAGLRASGAEVLVVTGDIAEPGIAERLVEAATGGAVPLRGVIHAAGVLADGAAATLDADDLERVWRPKVRGAWRLHEATLGHDLDWWLVYSSAAALLGSPGQTAYATANAWLDAFVEWRRAAGLTGTTINWGAWGEVGGAVGKSNPVLDPLDPEEGVEALEALLAEDRVSTGVARLDSATVLALFPGLAARPFLDLLTRDVETASSALPGTDAGWAGMDALRAGEPSAARAALAEHLAVIVSGLMGFGPEEVDRDRPLTQLGLDSLLAMRARGAVERDFGLALPVPLLLRGASLTEVAEHLAEQAGFGRGAARPAAVPSVIGPRDPAERWVARRWHEILAGREPGVYEDFFIVGGDSERAQRLADAFAEELSTVPDVETLFSTPTIAAMADVLRAEIEGLSGGPVRLLRDGVEADPVFLFHPAGGPTSVYRPLAGLLGEGVPVYGFERLDEVDTLEEKASCYAELVKEIQPSGPYRLGGWSFGGCLAYETAKQLTAAGEQVAVVFLIDTILPLAAPGRSVQDLLLDRFDRFAEHIELTYGVALEIPRPQLRELGEQEQIRLVMDLLADKVSGMGQGVLHHQYTSYLDARVAERYAPGPYGGRVVLFRAQEPHPLTTTLDPRYLRDDEALGWDGFCPRLEVVRVPGDHLSMIDPPNVAVIAEALDSVLEGPDGLRPVTDGQHAGRG